MSSRAKKKKSRVKKVSFKDKAWYTVLTPKTFNFKPIGEIIGMQDSLMGRTVEALLYDFTGKYSDISLKITFQIIEVNDEAKKCNTVFQGHSYTNDFIRSLIGRGSTKIQTIINLTTKDNYIFRLTTLCTTIKRARSSQQILIRKIMREILREFAKSLNHEKFIAGIIFGEFQNQVQRVAKTIYPLSNSVVIKSKLISIPEGGVDKEVPDDQFEIVEVEVKRSRKSEIKRSERINVKKLAQVSGKSPIEEDKTVDVSDDTDDDDEDSE